MSVRERIREVKHLRNRYFICVLEKPTDIMNIASTLRNVEAFGIEKLYLVGNKHVFRDFESSRKNKRLTNLSVGTNKWVFLKHFETTSECVAQLRKNLYTIAVTSSHIKGHENINLYEGTYTHKRLAVFFGNETKGISEEAVKSADMCIQIPMGGIVESLNLGTSTGIVLSYVGYQRLQFVYSHGKVRFKPKGIASLKMRSWQDFLSFRK
jgi:tRNA (guanosine-2'-O-)-methyltransferase